MSSEKSDRSKFLHRGAGDLVLQKLRHYCNYQERSHAEVKQKLWELRVRRSEVDQILATLIQEDYLNEERFAKAFAGGKFRLKEWGRKKIYHALKEKMVSEYNIKIAMKEINEEDYVKTAKGLAEKKYASFIGEQELSRKKKTMNYLLQKGYEPELVNNILEKLPGKQ